MKKKSLVLVPCGLVAFALIFLGIKFFVIAHYGSAIPFWDQWDAEAANLYKPYLEGVLSCDYFVAPHNEHRILTTRLLALLLLKLNGLWNPLLQMCVNAVLHLVTILVALFLIAYGSGRKKADLFLLLIFSSFLFFIPYGWENTLAGFQAQFYFVLLFSVLTLFLLIEKKLFTPLWLLGILSAVLAFFSLASGIFALAAVTAVFGIQYFLNVDRSWKKVIVILLLIPLVFLGIALTPILARHAPLKAHSVMQFATAFLSIMSWPLPGNLFWFFIKNAPSLIFCGMFFLYPFTSPTSSSVRRFRSSEPLGRPEEGQAVMLCSPINGSLFLARPPIQDRRWFLLGLIIWTSIQAISIAYGRTEGCLSSRYLDLFAFSVLINFACLLDLARIFHTNRLLLREPESLMNTALDAHDDLGGRDTYSPVSKYSSALPHEASQLPRHDQDELFGFKFPKNLFCKSIVFFWAVVIVLALVCSSFKNLPSQLNDKKRTGMAQALHVQNYQRSGDINDLKDKPFLEIPYPDPKRLADILASPTIQKILPTTIQKSASGTFMPVGHLDGFVDGVLSHALLFIALGVVIALVFLIC